MKVTLVNRVVKLPIIVFPTSKTTLKNIEVKFWISCKFLKWKTKLGVINE